MGSTCCLRPSDGAERTEGMTGEKIDAALKAKAVLRELVAFKANYEK
jgi:hypothetical protein